MSLYPIERWDGILIGNNLHMVPVIYIKPDLALLEFAKVNDFAVLCEITGTNTVYDNRKIPGVVDKSCYLPNCRPNFCEKTGLYIVTLQSNWYGYPKMGSHGSVKFYGLNAPAGSDNTVDYEQDGMGFDPSTLVTPTTQLSGQNFALKKKVKTTNFLLIFLVIVILFLLFMKIK